MIEGPIVQDQEVRHIKSGGLYIVLTGTHDPDDRKLETLAKIGAEANDENGAQNGWVPCIVYYDAERGEMTFVRDEASFREKFERA